MYAHLVAVSADAEDEMTSWSQDQIHDLLTGPTGLDIDKAWEAVFPLIGSIAGTGMMLTDDVTPIGADMGFGPAMLISSSDVAAIASAIHAADDAEVETHWRDLDSPFMSSGIYDEPEGKEYAMDAYRRTADLFWTAAASGACVLVAIL